MKIERLTKEECDLLDSILGFALYRKRKHEAFKALRINEDDNFTSPNEFRENLFAIKRKLVWIKIQTNQRYFSLGNLITAFVCGIIVCTGIHAFLGH